MDTRYWLTLRTLSLAALLSCGALAVAGCSSDDNAAASGRDAGPDAADDASEASDSDTAADDASPDASPPGATTLRFDPSDERFFALPFPDDARRKPDGSLGFVDWPGAMDNLLLKMWFPAADELLGGWGLTSGVHLHFTGPIDTSTLPPTPAASLATGDGVPSVLLVDVDPDSPERGRRFPLHCQFRERAGAFHDANLLGCIAPFGVTRRPDTRYAFVVTTALRDPAGEPVAAPAAMQRLLDGTDVDGRHGPVAAAPYTAALGELARLGLERDRIVALNLFTTGNPTRRLRQIADWYRTLPEPTIDTTRGLTLSQVYDDYVVLEGYYDVPVIQAGSRPYSKPPEGMIVLDDSGRPVLQDTQAIRFYLTVPRAPMPAGGFGAMLYLHGSGGRADELLDRGALASADDSYTPGTGPAMTLAQYGLAGFAADFNLHGMRHNPPDSTGLMLYNLLGNPRAAIDNFIIGANEVTLHARLLRNLTIDPAIAPEYLDAGDADDGLIRFDADRFAAMGQSMGSTIGLPALTVDHVIDAGIFSGSGGVLIEVALKSQKPVNVGAMVRRALRLRSDEPFDRFDPVLGAVQHVWDLVDPVAHGRHLFLEPHEGVPAKHALQHSGLDDSYFSDESRAAFTTAIGTPLVAPIHEPVALEIMGWVGLETPLEAPVSGNIDATITAVAAQYEPRVLDGHNVGFQVEAAKHQYACFVRSLGQGQAPVLRTVEDASPENCP